MHLKSKVHLGSDNFADGLALSKRRSLRYFLSQALYLGAAFVFAIAVGLFTYSSFHPHDISPSLLPLLRAQPPPTLSNSPPDTRVAVLIERREFNNMPALLLHFMSVLGPDWPIQVYHGSENFHILNNSRALHQYTRTGRLKLVDLGEERFENHNSVSRFLASKPFWEGLDPYEHILLFQMDSILCSNSPYNIDDFVGWSFIGAPIRPHYSQGVAGTYNGGLSLRRRSTALEVLDKYNYGDEGSEFEDQWFVERMRYGNVTDVNLPDEDFSSKFSVETWYSETPFGLHQAERYPVDLEETGGSSAKLLAYCPEFRLTQRGGPDTFGGR